MEKPWLQFYDEGVPSSIDYPEVDLWTLLSDVFKNYPDQVAVRMILKYLPAGFKLGAKLSYRELEDKVNRLATAMAGMGVKKGDRVAVQIPNSPGTVIAFLAIVRIGAIVVNTNPIYTSREMHHQFTDSGAKVVVIWNNLYPKLQEIQKESDIEKVIVFHLNDFMNPVYAYLLKNAMQKSGDWVDVAEGDNVYWMKTLIANNPPHPPHVDISPDDVALFQYTGGTTGTPKAAMLSHRNLIANVLQIDAWVPDMAHGKEVFMGAIPFFHVFGMTVAMLESLYVGGKLVLMPDPRDIETLMKLIQEEGVTLFPGVPTLYIAIINHKHVTNYNLKSVKACISGGAPMPVEVQRQFEEITGGSLREGYGLTETSPVTHSNPIFGKSKAGSIGLPFPDVEARIVSLDPDENGKFQTLGVGEEGELSIRAPQVMVGYWNRPEETRNVKDEEGWLYTGDIAKMDEDGYFYIVDRKKDLIIASGYNIVPREVEEVLFEHPCVQEAIVAGVPHATRGETVKAYVVLKPGETATEQEIIAFCKERLAPYKVPKMVEFRTELPKSMVGKFLRRVLVEEEKAKIAAQKAAEAGDSEA
ncbi:MAG: long-chain fatty acid--CoA ligase [Clostridia bacterium]|nr:MAG: long-chain fatty acid--CoA ligase [Clostridia bacterium]